MLKSIIIYTKKRFPVIPAFLFSLFFSMAGIAYIGKISENLQNLFFMSLLIFLFLLRIRLWDELKDFHYDSKHHKSRPVQKGLITLSSIKTTGLIVLLIEILIQFFFPPFAFLLFLFVLFYSFLMFKDFYIKNFEDKNFLAWLLSHQMIFIVYILYFLSIMNDKFFATKSATDLWFVVALFLPTLLYELGRKVKHRISTSGEKTNDTYIYRWGEKKAYTFLLALFFLQAFSIYKASGRFDILLITHITMTITAVALYFNHRKRLIATSKKWSIALAMYGLIILNLYLL